MKFFKSRKGACGKDAEHRDAPKRNIFKKAALLAASSLLISCGPATVINYYCDAGERDAEDAQTDVSRPDSGPDADVRGDSAPRDADTAETDAEAGPTHCPAFDDGQPDIVLDGLRTEPFLGDAEAQVTIIWLVDANGHYNIRFYAEGTEDDGRSTFDHVNEEMIETGEARIALHHFPLHFHPDAFRFAMYITCASPQEFEMLDMILRNQPLPYDAELFAAELDVGLSGFSACLLDNRTSDSINQQSADASSAGADGVPTFVIYNSSSGRCLTIPGDYPFAVFRDMVDRLR